MFDRFWKHCIYRKCCKQERPGDGGWQVCKYQKCLSPITKKQFHAFLGLAGYYRRLTWAFADVTAPPTELAKKDFQTCWQDGMSMNIHLRPLQTSSADHLYYDWHTLIGNLFYRLMHQIQAERRLVPQRKELLCHRENA